MEQGESARHDDARATTSSALERDARRWLRAYPRRWRRPREEEVLGLLADLAEPGATRLDARARWELVREGLATRWRTRPPWGAWLLYRFFDRRIPREHADWAADDIDGFWYNARTYLAGVWWLPFFHLWFMPRWSLQLGLIVGAMALVAMLLPDHGRRKARLKHVVVRAGDPWLPGCWVTREAPRERVSARSAGPWLIGLLGATALIGTTSTLLGPKTSRARRTGPAEWELYVGPVGELRVAHLGLIGAALLLGLVLAAVGARLSRRRLTELPAQPWRQVRPMGVLGRVRVVLVAGLTLVLAWLETTGALVVWLGTVLAAVAVLLLPGALVAARVVRDSPVAPSDADLAVSDVWKVMTSGVPPEVDRPAEVAVPHTGPLPDGAVLPPRWPSPPYPASLPR